MTAGDAQSRPRMTTPKREPHDEVEQHRRAALKALMGEQVMRALGQPGSLYQVQVRPLWEDHYRVNVFVGVDAASAKVAHSYFLVADSDGKIVASTPKITKTY
jgi:hypothetical protein